MARFRVAQLAQERGLSMTELHRLVIQKAPPDRPELARISYRTVQRVYTNKTTTPAYDTLEGIAIALGVEVRDLYATSDDSTQGVAQKNLEPLCA